MSLPQLFKYGLRRLYQRHPAVATLRRSIDTSKILGAKVLTNQASALGIVDDLSRVEFKVFSQFGEDGIIQYLLRHVDVPSHRFVEFGVGDYSESNTRFLLISDNWSGLIIDGDPKNIALVRSDPTFWMSDLTALARFIDRDNICSIIDEAGCSGSLGILSVDIDGNDYWVWERLTNVDPAIVIAEYNSVFGATRAVTIPYSRSFQRYGAHYSGLYWGASLKALCLLAARKGYAFVGSNSAGNNAFFVRRNLVKDLKTFTAESGYVESKFRDSRDRRGRLNYLSGEARLAAIADMPLYDVELDTVVQADLLLTQNVD